MKDFFGEDLCAAAAQAYMESLLSGESGAKASEAAEIAYKAAWRTCALLQPRLTWRVCCQGRVGRRQAKQQRLPTKQLGGLELELNQAAHAQLPRLPSGAAMIPARTRSQTPLVPLPSPGLDLRRATPAPCPPRPTWSRSSEESRLTMP